jgi:two-component system NarL family response regulator
MRLDGAKYEGLVMIRVLVALKRRICLQAVAAFLNKEPDIEVVATATSGPEVLHKVDETRPDVAVLGWYIQHLNGLETTRALATRDGAPGVILFSDYPEDRSVVQAIQAGAKACVGTQSSITHLLKVIRQVARGKVSLSREADHIMVAAIKSRHAEPREVLTARERQVLLLIAEGFTTQETATRLGVAKKTVDRHRATLMEKLDIHNVASLTRYAVRQRLIEP